jgi:histidinol dehydrogenase
MPKRLNTADKNFTSNFNAVVAAKRDAETDVSDVVKGIIADVKKRGDKAVVEYTRQFDRFDIPENGLRVPLKEIESSREACDSKIIQALELAAERIRDFHRRQLPENLDYYDPQGIRLGYRWTPIRAVGLYVPGGTAAYPSSVLMNGIPATVAGVDRIVMTVPATEGELNPLVLAAAQIVGIDEIYKIGGAQAIAALAYGTDSIQAVDKIVGPGNIYVATAKQQVYGTVGIDMIAGPSEILVVADDQNDPSWIAADLLSQAEHDESAQSILITNSGLFATAVEDAVREQMLTLPRKETAQKSWDQHGIVIIVKDLSDTVPLIDQLAPEHLELAVEEADQLAAQVRNAGSIFIGRNTPEAVGDYIAGPNHVLPTARSARFSSGLGVLDFMKRSTFVKCDEASLKTIGSEIITLAEAEGLDAHARSVSIRLKQKN